MPSENKAPRPFWRIAWDLFDYPRSLTGNRWLLAVKDEFSGKLFQFPLKSKNQEEVFQVIRNFDTWVRRQYGLAVCKIRQDNDTGAIGIWCYTEFQHWVEEEGIDLENPPSRTKEPNDIIERDGQEIITKALRMKAGAGLPVELLPGSTEAAAWLYNRSPLRRHH
jgi:hypothetical protein